MSRRLNTICSKFILVALLIASLAAPAASQNQSIRGPVLGFTRDGAGAAISPIFGVVGASVVGQRLEIPTDIRNVVISPDHNYALALRDEDGKIVSIKLAESSSSIRVLPDLRAGADLIAISPSGTAAAVYDGGSGLLQTIKGLPETPELVYQFDASLISGEASGLAVSDDGAVAIVNLVDRDRSGAWVVAAGGSLKRLPPAHLSSMAFLAGRHDAIFADDAAQEVFLLTDVEGTGTRLPLISLDRPPGTGIDIATSKDGGLAILIAAQSQEITIVDVDTRTRSVIACACWPTVLHRLKGDAVFSLTELSDGTLYVLDASLPEPRIVVIPPSLFRAGLDAEGVDTQ